MIVFGLKCNFTQKESLRLDTDLKDACKSDREKFCKDVKTGRGAVSYILICTIIGEGDKVFMEGSI